MGRSWTPSEDDLLREMISKYGKQWSVIASQFPNRSATQIAARWDKCINPVLTKGPFTPEEDQMIIDFVAEHGSHAWPKITSHLPHRTAKQCRERWFNNLDPSVVKAPWTPEEDQLIFENYITLGPKWSVISNLIPGRTDNSIKNRFNASISKRMKMDEDGNQVLAPCKPRKQRVTKKREQLRPPPLQIVSETDTPPSSPPMISFTPIDSAISFNKLPTPTFDYESLGNMISPMRDFTFENIYTPILVSPIGFNLADF